MKMTPHRKHGESVKKYKSRRVAEAIWFKVHMRGKMLRPSKGPNRLARMAAYAKARKQESNVMKPHNTRKAESSNRGHMLYSRLFQRAGVLI